MAQVNEGCVCNPCMSYKNVIFYIRLTVLLKPHICISEPEKWQGPACLLMEALTVAIHLCSFDRGTP